MSEMMIIVIVIGIIVPVTMGLKYFFEKGNSSNQSDTES